MEPDLNVEFFCKNLRWRLPFSILVASFSNGKKWKASTGHYYRILKRGPAKLILKTMTKGLWGGSRGGIISWLNKE